MYAFLDRPIEGVWPDVRLDATCVKARQNGRTASGAVINALNAQPPASALNNLVRTHT